MAVVQSRADPVPDQGSTGDRLALGIFLAVCVLAVPFYLWAGRDQWFFQDEFAVLVSEVRSPLDLFHPHNEHLIVPTRLMYLVLWPVFGLNQYLPYQVVVVVTHVAIAVLMRLVLVRSGVGAWVATAGAIVFLAFGRGSENIVWAFQVGLSGSIATGYLYLYLTMHDGPLRRRDVAALAVGIVAVLSSGPAVAMVVAVGITSLLRRGLRVAAFHTVPLLGPMGLWFLLGRDASAGSAPALVVRFVAEGVRITVERTTVGLWGSVLVGLVACLGLALQIGDEGLGPFARRVAAPLGLAVAALANWFMIGYSRAESHGVEFSQRPRYSHLALAMGLPLVVVGVEGVARRWRFLLVPVLAVLLAGVPANLKSVEIRSNRDVPPDLVLAVANSALLEDVERDREVFPGVTGFRHVTAGWLVDARHDGKIPSDASSDWAVTEATRRLAFEVEPVAGSSIACREASVSKDVVLERGASVVVSGQWIAWVKVASHGSVPLPVSSEGPVAVVAIADGLRLTMTPFTEGSGRWCWPN